MLAFANYLVRFAITLLLQISSPSLTLYINHLVYPDRGELFLYFIRCQGQGNGESATGINIRFHLDGSAVVAYDPKGDGKT
jgi:hypothetical protein